MTDTKDTARLSPADADALDALIDARFDLDAVPPFLRDRSARLAALMGLLEPAQAIGAGANPLGAATHEPVALSPSDAAALDALVENGWSAASAPAHLRQRSNLIDSLVSALASASSADEALLDATLARIERSRRTVAAVEARPARFRMPHFADLLGVAAMLVIASAIMWPMVAGVRHQQMRVTESARLASAGLGFSMYANDHADRLPAADATRAGRTPGVVWWNVGSPGQSHAANLFVLVRAGYASPEDLASPANPFAPIRIAPDALDWEAPEQVSFSYQLLGPGSVRWSSPDRHVVLATRSPVIELARAGFAADPLMNSTLHRGMGQHVLFNDRSVRWLESPVTPWGDNIWLPRQLERILTPTLRGVELPAGHDDAFVGP